MLERYTPWLDSSLARARDGEWVRYEDAEKLQMRIIELEQQLKTQDQLRAEFEKECG